MHALEGQAFYITCRCLRTEKPEVLRVNEMHSAVVMSGYGQILCLGGAPPVGSLSLVYMRRLDTGRPCAVLPRVNGPHHQHRYPRWKSAVSPDRQCIKETEDCVRPASSSLCLS